MVMCSIDIVSSEVISHNLLRVVNLGGLTPKNMNNVKCRGHEYDYKVSLASYYGVK